MNNKASKISFLVLLLILVIAFAVIIRPFLFPALIAFLIAVICRPINRFFHALFKGRAVWSSLASTLIVSLCVLVPLSIIITVAAVNGVDAVKVVISKLEVGQIAQAIDTANAWMQAQAGRIPGVSLPDFNLRARMVEFLSSVGSVVYEYSPRVFTATLSIFAGFLLVVIFVFIFFLEGAFLSDAVISLLPLEPEHKKILIQEITSVITGTFTGMILTACAQGLLIGIGYWIAGLSNPAVWGALAIGVTLIPVIGGPVMYVPPAAALIIGGHYYSGLFLLLYGVGIVSTVDNVIKPLAMRGKVNVHPVLLALALVGGTLWLGTAGIIVGPVVVALMLAMIRIYRKEFL